MRSLCANGAAQLQWHTATSLVDFKDSAQIPYNRRTSNRAAGSNLTITRSEIEWEASSGHKFAMASTKKLLPRLQCDPGSNDLDCHHYFSVCRKGGRLGQNLRQKWLGLIFKKPHKDTDYWISWFRILLSSRLRKRPELKAFDGHPANQVKFQPLWIGFEVELDCRLKSVVSVLWMIDAKGCSKASQIEALH